MSPLTVDFLAVLCASGGTGFALLTFTFVIEVWQPASTLKTMLGLGIGFAGMITGYIACFAFLSVPGA